ncbi:hypothetical protein ACTXT7_010600 [Hymenolepis weldensis]
MRCVGFQGVGTFDLSRTPAVQFFLPIPPHPLLKVSATEAEAAAVFSFDLLDASSYFLGLHFPLFINNALIKD